MHAAPRRDHRDFLAELDRFQAGEPALTPWWLERPRYRHEQPSPYVSRDQEWAWLAVGGLSTPGKMPGTSYNLPAGTTCANGRRMAVMVPLLGEPHVCASCYAMQGRYVRLDCKVAGYRRLAALIAQPVQWQEGMVALLRDYAGRVEPAARYHRWHDSGDIVSVEHLHLLVTIARAVPEMHFWLPTQQGNFLAEYRGQTGPFPENFVPRLSAARLDRQLPAWTSSMVYRDTPPAGIHACPAVLQGGQCGACRSCWSHDVRVVGYRQHGRILKGVRVPPIPPYYLDMADKLRDNLPSELLPTPGEIAS